MTSERVTLDGCKTVARCSKCGRQFVSHPRHYPATDPFPSPEVYFSLPQAEREKIPPCGGEIKAVRQ